MAEARRLADQAEYIARKVSGQRSHPRSWSAVIERIGILSGGPAAYDCGTVKGNRRGRHADDDEPYLLPPDEPFTLASYVAGPSPEAYVEHLTVGGTLTEMPLFLNPDRYINLPLETSYSTAYRGLPSFWRGVLEGMRSWPRR